MKEIRQQLFEGERALFQGTDLKIYDSIFDNGESPLKEAKKVELVESMFRWKYPLWYCEDIKTLNCVWFDMARAGVWYSNRVLVENSMIQAPKNFRRCSELTLRNVTFTNAAETLWNCDHVTMESVTAKGDYFAMNMKEAVITGLHLDGNYSFDGAENVEVKDSVLLSKDAFWNSNNVTVSNTFISGEYLGWNSKNLTLVDCTIESLQGMCYIQNLVMKNCKVINTTLAFENATVEAELTTKIDSVFNPLGGTIKAVEIGELIVEDGKVDISKTNIICGNIVKKSDKPEWL